MIFATIGTQIHNFKRFADIINQINDNDIIFQYGSTDINSVDNSNIQMFKYVDNMKESLSDADVIITHGGVASIMQALEMKKKIIVIPRLKKYSEHVNDHQLEIVNKLESDNYIYQFHEFDDINEVLKKVKNQEIKLREYQFDNSQLIDSLIRDITGD